MKSIMIPAVLCLLSACASRQPDHFYVLHPDPQSPVEGTTGATVQVMLSVSLPSLVDRAEIVLNTGADRVIVLEHERWAAPLTDLVAQTLAEDMERRRHDLLIAGPGASPAGSPVLKVAVDIVQMTARRGALTSIVTHWRILDSRTGVQATGGQEFSAALGGDGYAAIAQALSDCLALLADRLVADLAPPH